MNEVSLKFQTDFNEVIPGFNRQDAEDCGWIISYLLGTNIGVNLYLQRNKSPLTIFINRTAEKFISSDVPIVNLAASKSESEYVAPTLLDAFYPVSPTVGVLLNESGKYELGVVYVDSSDVEYLNHAIASNADEDIFGSSKASVDKYKRIIVNR